jgi:2-haloacid dehalogenase
VATTVLFDVNETLSDLAPLRRRFEDLGLPGELAQVWFASTLRDGFALTVVGRNPAFLDLARDAARTLVGDAGVDHVLGGFAELGLHADVAPGVRALRAAGLRLATLSNGSPSVAERLLSEEGLREEFDVALSVEDAGAWKPAPEAYEYAVRVCGVEPADVVMVAVHPWDLLGAAHAGLRTAWVDRLGAPYPRSMPAPDVVVRRLDDLAFALSR